MRRCLATTAGIAVTAVVAAAGCAQTVSGEALRGTPQVPDPTRSYGYLDDRCGLLLDESIAEILGADDVTRPYSGAVCHYVLSRGGAGPAPDAPAELIDVTFSWFETGSMDRERTVAVDRGAQLTDTVVERHDAFLARRDGTGPACSATAAAGPGVLSWWVQFRGPDPGDPCRAAERLLAGTLSADM